MRGIWGVARLAVTAAVSAGGLLLFLSGGTASADASDGTSSGTADHARTTSPPSGARHHAVAASARGKTGGPAATASTRGAAAHAVPPARSRRITLAVNDVDTAQPLVPPAAAGGTGRRAGPAESLPAATPSAQVPYTDWNADRNLFIGRPAPLNELLVGALKVFDRFIVHGEPSGDLTTTTPPWFSTLGLTVQASTYDDMPVYTLSAASPSGKYVVAVHGGGYVSQTSILEWLTYGSIARRTGATVVVPMYAVAGRGGSAATEVPAMADFLTSMVDAHGPQNVSIVGASAGGGLALAATQEMVRRGDTTPGRMVLVSPWLDATVSDPASHLIDDPLLDVAQLQHFAGEWAHGMDLADPRISPLYGVLTGLPPTTVYSSSEDLLAPDTLRLRQQALVQGLNMTFVLRAGQVHGWPLFFPLPDSLRTLRSIDTQLGLSPATSVKTGQPKRPHGHPF